MRRGVRSLLDLRTRGRGVLAEQESGLASTVPCSSSAAGPRSKVRPRAPSPVARRVTALLILLGPLLPAQEAAVRLLGFEGEPPRLGERAELLLEITAPPEVVELGTLAVGPDFHLEPRRPRPHEGRDGARWTRWAVGVEALVAGEIVLPPFEVAVRGARRISEELRFMARREVSGPRHARLELELPERPFYVGERVRVRLVIALERSFFAERVLDPWRGRLDLPVAVRGPFRFETGEGVATLLSPAAPAGTASLVVDGERHAAERLEPLVEDGERFDRYAITWRFAPDLRGAERLAPAVLEFAHASSFREDLLGGRRPVDRHEAFVVAASRRVDVRELDPRTTPFHFTGAFAPFEATLEFKNTELEVGDVLEGVLRITIEGGLAKPRPPGFRVEGLRRRGVRARPRPDGVDMVYEWAVEGVREEFPARVLSWFDPTPPGSFRERRLEALPLRIRGAATGRPGVGDDTAVVRLGDAEAETEERPVVSAPRVALLVGGLTVCVILLLARAPRGDGARRREEAAAHRAARARAVERSRRRASARALLAHPEGREPRDARFAEYLGALADLEAPALVAPEAPERLRAAGVPEELAVEAARLLEALVAARYGGPAVPDGAARLEALRARLDAALS